MYLVRHPAHRDEQAGDKPERLNDVATTKDIRVHVRHIAQQRRREPEAKERDESIAELPALPSFT